ncbi:MAG: VWA domain-containing protein [Treponema sp.]|uniref:VWA domain-containing protein n=1 Tax=Treponema sp. TaxID=166 RepID=UPI001B650793|nr:VWA domain-containing protein [Treponema sp.]MBP5401698.1 VWA domain-containing protein [Treponema sp.]MBR5933607.1 VWA domain-containing protein [Treponema sp.]
MSVDYTNPSSFLLLLLIPLLYALRKIKVFNKISLPLTFSDWNGYVFTWNDKLRKVISNICEFFCVAGFVLVVIAFAEPVVHHQEKVYTSRGTDVLFVLDVSYSMAAKDINGMSRLEAAISTIEKLVNQNPGASYGLIQMGQEAAVTVPITNDIETFKSRISSLSVGMMGDGSAIGTGLSSAVYHIKDTDSKRKCIILLTDGENNAGEIHPETAASLAKKTGVILYVVGIGTKGTVLLEYVDPVTGKFCSGYYDSYFDSTVLEKIAIMAEGRYYSVESLSAMSMALSAIIKRQDVVQSYYIRTIDEYYYDKILVFALFCIAAGWLIKRVYLKEFI